MISIARIMSCTPWRNDSTSKVPSARRYFMRLNDARLQALSSRNMYSEHGFDARMGAVPLHVCHLLMVVSYCTPGSPHTQAASAILRHTPRESCSSSGLPERTALVKYALPSTTAFMNVSVTRTECLAFWKNTESYAPPGTLKPP